MQPNEKPRDFDSLLTIEHQKEPQTTALDDIEDEDDLP